MALTIVLTDVPHRPERCVRRARVQREGEESAVRAFAPLEVCVLGDVEGRFDVGCCRGDAGAE